MADLGPLPDLNPKVTVVRDRENRVMAYVDIDALGYCNAVSVGYSFQYVLANLQSPSLSNEEAQQAHTPLSPHLRAR